jgi:predicted nucleotidyltransferase
VARERPMPAVQIDVPMEKIRDYCRKWKIKELSLFGSVLREDFRTESDVDVLVSFHPDETWDLFDWVDMIEELKQLYGREVDLVEKGTIVNPFRRHEILKTRQLIYADE